jgi:hypothetical protein
MQHIFGRPAGSMVAAGAAGRRATSIMENLNGR